MSENYYIKNNLLYKVSLPKTKKNTKSVSPKLFVVHTS